jgi:hypothetical protein
MEFARKIGMYEYPSIFPDAYRRFAYSFAHLSGNLCQAFSPFLPLTDIFENLRDTILISHVIIAPLTFTTLVHHALHGSSLAILWNMHHITELQALRQALVLDQQDLERFNADPITNAESIATVKRIIAEKEARITILSRFE